VFEVKGEDDLWEGAFILICCSDQAAMDLSKKDVICFNKHNLETELLSSMLVKKRFSMKVKNFKDDPAFKDKDNDRRLVLPSSKLSNDAAEALEKHIRETRTGVKAWHKTVCNLHIVTFNDTASASGALQVMEEDRGLVEKPEQLMLLVEYMEAWQRALDRQKEREEAAVKEAEDQDEVEEGVVQSEDEGKPKEKERKRAEEKEKEDEEARKVEEIRKAEEKKEKEEKRKAELRAKEEKNRTRDQRKARKKETGIERERRKKETGGAGDSRGKEES